MTKLKIGNAGFLIREKEEGLRERERLKETVYSTAVKRFSPSSWCTCMSRAGEGKGSRSSGVCLGSRIRYSPDQYMYICAYRARP